MRNAECRLLRRSDAAVSVWRCSCRWDFVRDCRSGDGMVGEDGLDGQWSLVRED